MFIRILVIISVFLFINIIGNRAYATEYASVNKTNVAFDYTKVDIASTLKKADNYFDLSIKTEDEDERKLYLQKALLEYNILTQTKQNDTYPITRLGRIYDMLGQDRYSKSAFSRALNINYKDIDANYYFADFYYKRQDFRKALKYYRKSLEYGKKEDFEILNKMGEIYEKFADMKRAGICYKRAFLINPKNEDIPERIRDIEEIDYNSTGYYNRRKPN